MKQAFLALSLGTITCTVACIGPAKEAPKGVPDAGTAPTPQGIGMAVVSNDAAYTSSLVSLVDATGNTLLQDDCIDSGSKPPVLSLALSGDVVLPSQKQPGDALILIDQENSALVWLKPGNCSVSQDLSVATGFSSDPYDVVGLSATKAYVSRYATNPTPSGTPGANDQGADLLIINPSTQTITGRIDLSAYATTVSGATIQADPARAVLANGNVYVTLENISGDFMTTGPARIVIVDPNTDTVTGTIDPPTVKNCQQLSSIDSANELLVVCTGDYNADLTTQVSQSAVLVYDISGDTPSLMQTIPASSMSGQPLINYLLTAVNDEYAIAATFGTQMPMTPDELWNLDLKTGTATKIEDADGYLTLGSALYVAANQTVVVTDASSMTPHIAIFDVSNPASPVAKGTFNPDPKAGLLPHVMAWY